MLKKIELFEARKDGYHVYRIPNIVVTKNNVVLVTTEARQGRGGDWDNIDVMMRRSIDGGVTFEPRVKIVDHKDYGEGPSNNFVFISDMQSGRVVSVFCNNYSRVFTMYSDDDGVTFTKPTEITDVFNYFKKDYEWSVCATGPGHGIQLKNGRMIIPVWLSVGTGNEFGKDHLGHRPSDITSIYSDDGGLNWKPGEIICRNKDSVNEKIITNPNETTAVELSDGRILFNIRSESDSKRRFIAISPNGYSDWDLIGFDENLLEPVCMGSIIKNQYIYNNNLILFSNPDNLENELIPPGNNVSHDRKCLTIHISNDDCKTWFNKKILEEGPAGYSDLAQLKTGEFLCFYECDLESGMFDDKYLRLAKFDLNWLLEIRLA